MKKVLLFFTMLMVSSMLAYGQQHTVSGKVVGEDGSPIPFATVQIKGTTSGTTTDEKGNFHLSVPSNATLHISYVGFNPKDVVVGDQSTLNITLASNARQLNEIVVTALGIKREARALGYSTATISNKELNVSKPVNIAQGLMGQVAGAQVSVINNGVDPQIRIQLRGERHINSDNQPLIIVDGMEVRSDFLATLNPEDVANVSILKGASAAALYGSEASNGVVIITTKTGSANGKPTINVSQTATFEKLSYFPALQTTYSGYGGEAGTFFGGTPYQFDATNKYTGYPNYIPFENQQYGPPFDGNPANGWIGIPNADGKVDSVPFEPQSVDPRKQFFQTGFTSQTDVSLANGDSKNSNFVGLQYVSVKGTTPKDKANRASVRIGGKRTYGVFSYDYTMNYSYKYSNTVAGDITYGWPIYWTLLNTPANIPVAQLKDWQDPNSWGNLSNYYNAYYINPWWQVDNSRNTYKQDNIQGVVSANVKPLSWLTATYRLSGQISATVYKNWRNAANFTPYAIAAYGPPVYGTPASGDIAGAVYDESLVQRRLQQDILVTLEHKFGDFTGTLILGNTIWDRYANDQHQQVGSFGGPQSQTSGLTLPNIYNIAYSYGIPSVGQYVQDTRLIGTYGDLTIGYKDFLFLHGNYRRDYSSLLATGHNSYDVYGVDASWVFSDNLPMFKDSRIFSYGKLRAAYSKTGEITLGPYSTVNTFNVPGPYPYGGLAALSLSSNYNNPANVPEGTKEKEAGIELGFLQDRVNVEATYYYDDNYNQLFSVGLTPATGFTSANVNAAETTSTGWEFDVKATPVKSTNVSWQVGANLAIQTTTVKALYGTGSNKTTQTGIGNDNEAIVGMAFPQLYVSDFVRDPATGNVVVDAQGYPELSSTDIAAGRTTPKYILGLTTSLTYKGFSLQVIGDYRGGYYFYNNAEQNLDFTGASAHTATNGRQNFIYPNSEIQTGTANGKPVYAPNTSTYTQDGNLGFWVSSNYRSAGTAYVQSAAAWKIRTISLSYDFSHLISGQKVLKGLKLSALCNNVLMLRPKENNFTDPEFNYNNANGLGYNTYYELPPTRQFTFVADLTF